MGVFINRDPDFGTWYHHGGAKVRVDYLPYVKGRAIGDVKAKPAAHTLGRVEYQSGGRGRRSGSLDCPRTQLYVWEGRLKFPSKIRGANTSTRPAG